VSVHWGTYFISARSRGWPGRPLEYSDSNKERNSSPSHGTEHTKNLPYRVQTRSQRHTTHEPQQVAIGTNQTAKRNILGVGPATILRGAPKQAASNENQDKRQPPITQPQQARRGSRERNQPMGFGCRDLAEPNGVGRSAALPLSSDKRGGGLENRREKKTHA